MTQRARNELIIRCFLYLFPSVQTWYLVLVLIAFMYVVPLLLVMGHS